LKEHLVTTLPRSRKRAPQWQVALTKDSNSSGGKGKGGGAQEEYGVLKFAAADLKFEAKKPKPRFSTTYLSSIRDVELQEKAITGLQEGNRCRVEVRFTYTFYHVRWMRW